MEWVTTFLGDSANQAGEVNINIKAFDYVLEKTDGIPSMVQINELWGLRMDFLTEALKHGWIKKVPIIQIGWHSYGDMMSGLVLEQCNFVRSEICHQNRL